MINGVLGTVGKWLVIGAIKTVNPVWRILNFLWAKFRPLESPTKFAVEWFDKKGYDFGTFYKDRIKDEEFRKRTVNDVIASGSRMMSAFEDGVRRGAGV